ncbi:hypothetical protein D3C80_592130 [compost metagenome]
MQLDARIGFTQRWPFALCFLHAVFAEDPLACVEGRANVLGLECFGHGNECHRALIAACFFFGIGNDSLDLVQVRYNI